MIDNLLIPDSLPNRILFSLSGLERGLTGQELNLRFNATNRHTVCNAVRKLADNGFVSQFRDGLSRRNIITEAGKEHVARIRAKKAQS